MATLIFQNNLQNLYPWKFDPYSDLSSIPSTFGVYIAGVKIEVEYLNGKKEKFCPLYVGETGNLQKRLMGHWDKYNSCTAGGEINSFKELFDLNKCIKHVYDDMNSYKNIGKSKNYSVIQNNTLIWYNNSTFFNFYLKLQSPNLSNYADGSGHIGSYSDLPNLSGGTILWNNILEIKGIIESKFWFAYSVLSPSLLTQVIAEGKAEDGINNLCNDLLHNGFSHKKTKPILRMMEAETSAALKMLGIYTTSKADNPKGVFSIDLSQIKADIVDMQQIKCT